MVFYLFPAEGKPFRDALSKSMMSYWTQMAYSAKPGKGRDGLETAWEPWQNGPGKPKMIIFDTTRDGGIRMSDYEITDEGFKGEFLADTTFENQEIHCETYVAAFLRNNLFDPVEYKFLGKEGCSGYTKDDFLKLFLSSEQLTGF